MKKKKSIAKRPMWKRAMDSLWGKKQEAAQRNSMSKQQKSQPLLDDQQKPDPGQPKLDSLFDDVSDIITMDESVAPSLGFDNSQ